MTSRVCRALSAFALFVGAISLLPGSAHADASRSDTQPVEVGINQVSPQIPDFTDTTKTMTFAGQVHNTGTTALKNIHLELQRNQVTARSDLGSADGTGYLVDDKAVRMKITTLAGGGTQSWKFTPTERVLFGYDNPVPGVYAFDVDAFDSEGTFLGGQRTYVVWKPAKQEDSKVARVVLMWPVVGQPGLTGQKTANSVAPLITDQMAADQFAPDQRLSKILGESQGMTVNYLLDPDLLYTAHILSSSYFYLDKDKKQIGAPGINPANWYSKATALFTQTKNCWNLLYGDPDVNTLARSQPGKDLLAVATGVDPPITVGACRQNGKTTIAWPSDGQADAGTLAALAGTKASNLITLVGSNQVSAWPSAHAALPNSPNTVVYDNYLSSVFPDTAKPAPPSLNNEGVLSGQIWLAQTALADRDDTSRALVVTPPRDFDPAPELLSAINAMAKMPAADQWFGLDSLNNVLNAPATTEHASALTKVGTANLPDPVVDSAFDSQQLYHSLYAVMVGHDNDPDVSLRPVATWWRNHPGGTGYSQAVYTTAVADHGLVSFGDQVPPLTMSGKSGTVPVTIKNETTSTIRIYLRAQDQGAFTMELKVNEDQGPHDIDRGQVATVRIPVVARGNGQQVRLIAQLYYCHDTSQDCTYYPSNLITPLKTNGGLTKVTVKVSRIGIIALALIIGSGLLLILLIGLRVYRAKRHHHAPAQDTMAS